MALLPGAIRSLFEFEVNSIRFERVCIDLYRDAEGVELVPTSRTWDQGRDGRCISIEGRESKAVLCATLSADIDSKVEADINRLLQTTETKTILYCTSRSLSERACDKIGAKIRDIYPSVESVRVLGQEQLVALGERSEEILRRHYQGEINNIEQALLVQRTSPPEPEQIALRLALLTQTGDDARKLRQELSSRLILETLHAKGPQSSGQIATAISSQLHLPRSLSAVYIDEVLSNLYNDSFAVARNGKAAITQLGIGSINAIPPEASTRLLEGRAAIRDAIRSLSGHNLNDHQYERVWNCLQDGLSDLFYSKGMAIVRMISSLITGETTKPRPKERLLLEKIGERIGVLLSNIEQGREVGQAITDMFSEKESQAFDWLTQICSVYVMMCSLGFEAMSSAQITRLLRNFHLVADTDILISLLCEREDNHEQIVRIISGWKLLGGKLLMSKYVLEEVAYHAWIADREYRNVLDQLKMMSEIEGRRLIDNAFVRTFKILSSDETIDMKHWSSYISQYQGDTKRDYGHIMEILRHEYGFDMLPDADESYNTFAEQVKQVLIKMASELARCNPDDLSPEVEDKCIRDGDLMASMKAARDSARQAGTQTSVILLSSARLLKEIDQVFRKEIGKPDGVVSVAALGCLLTLTPGVQMGMGTLRGVLFDLGLARRLTSLQRYAYRLIAASREYDLPWSRRVTLENELAEKLFVDARGYGEPVREIRKKVLKFEDPKRSARIVAETLDQMAVTPKTEAAYEREVERLRKEIEKLNEEVEARKRIDRRKVSKRTIEFGKKKKKRKKT